MIFKLVFNSLLSYLRYLIFEFVSPGAFILIVRTIHFLGNLDSFVSKQPSRLSFKLKIFNFSFEFDFIFILFNVIYENRFLENDIFYKKSLCAKMCACWLLYYNTQTEALLRKMPFTLIYI